MKRTGFWLMFGGFAFAILPIIAAVLGAVISGAGVFNESEGAGSLLWFLFLTFPVGLVAGTEGFVLFLIGHSRERQPKNPPAM